jgi:hypothetical protein
VFTLAEPPLFTRLRDARRVGLAQNVGYLPLLEELEEMAEVSLAIELYREEVPRRPRRSIPL